MKVMCACHWRTVYSTLTEWETGWKNKWSHLNGSRINGSRFPFHCFVCDANKIYSHSIDSLPFIFVVKKGNTHVVQWFHFSLNEASNHSNQYHLLPTAMVIYYGFLLIQCYPVFSLNNEWMNEIRTEEKSILRLCTTPDMRTRFTSFRHTANKNFSICELIYRFIPLYYILYTTLS